MTTHTNTADRVLGIHIAPPPPPGQFLDSWVDLLVVKGFDAGQPILYLSTETDDPLAAVLERSVYVPALANAAYNGGDDFLGSARERLFGFINGQTGADNPQAQIDENVVFNLAATRPDLITGPGGAPYGSVGIDINCAVLGFTNLPPTANLAAPVPNSQFPPR